MLLWLHTGGILDQQYCMYIKYFHPRGTNIIQNMVHID